MDAVGAFIFMFCCSICCSPVLFYICFLYVHTRQAVLRRWIPPGRVHLYAQMRFPVTGDKSNLPNNIISNHIPNIPGSRFWPWAQHWGLNHMPSALLVWDFNDSPHLSKSWAWHDHDRLDWQTEVDILLLPWTNENTHTNTRKKKKSLILTLLVRSQSKFCSSCCLIPSRPSWRSALFYSDL